MTGERARRRQGWVDFDTLYRAFKPRENATERVKALLDAGANANASPPDGGYTILHLAAQFEPVEMVRMLIDAGADVNARNEDGRGAGQTPLHFAAKGGEARAVKIKALVDAGADVNAEDRCWDRDGGNYTPLHYAAKARDGSADAIGVLLEAGAAVDARSAGNRTALHFAARYSDAHVVGALVDGGADVMARDQNHWTPLHFVSKRWHPGRPAKCVEAAVADSAAIVEALLEAGVDVDIGSTPRGGGSPLTWAAYEQSVPMVQILLDAGANVTGAVEGDSPLLHAVLGSDDAATAAVVRILIGAGANVNIRGPFDDRTPLHYASERLGPETVRLLINAGADVAARSRKHLTPLHCAAGAEYPERTTPDRHVIAALIAAGADVTAASPTGTPLECIARTKDPRAISAVLNSNAREGAKSQRRPWWLGGRGSTT